MMFKRFKGVLNFTDSTFHFISHFLNTTFHRAILRISRLNATSFTFNYTADLNFNSLSGTIGIELLCQDLCHFCNCSVHVKACIFSLVS